MGRTGATVGEQGELARIVSALDGGAAQKVRHPAVQHFADAPGRLDGVHAERLCHLVGHGAQRRLDVEAHASADEIVRVEHAENEVGVGRGRFEAAASVARRPGSGAGALRADAEHPEADRRDAAAARTDRVHVDRGDADVRPGDRDFAAHDRPAVGDHADVEARAADVGGQDVVAAETAADDH